MSNAIKGHYVTTGASVEKTDKGFNWYFLSAKDTIIRQSGNISMVINKPSNVKKVKVIVANNGDIIRSKTV